MLTGREREEDRITGLEAGVDDYITKPFFPRELLARMRAVIRRCKPHLTENVIEICGLTPRSRRAPGRAATARTSSCARSSFACCTSS